MTLIRYNDHEFDERNARCWTDLTPEGKRLIVVSGFIRASTTGARREALDAILKATREENGKLYYGNFDRYLNVRRKEPVIYAHSYNPWPPMETSWAAKFDAEDPFWYAEEETEISVSYTGAFNVPVTGDAKAFALFRVGFTGAASSGIELKNNTTSKSLDYDKAIASGDVLEIDSINEEIRKNGVVDMDETEDRGFFELEPGDNEIELDCSPAQCDLTITFRERWF